MKPLSNFNYYRCNKGKLALLVIPLFLSVVLLYSIHMVIASYYYMQYNAFVETRKVYTSVQARGDLITADTIQIIKENENTEKIVPCVLGYTEVKGIISTIGIRVYLLYQNDLQELVGRMGLILQEGRFPEPGKKEVIFHENILKNKNLSIGDWVGNDILPNEKLLGQYKIVGSVKGKALAGFASLEAWEAEITEKPSEYGILIYAKSGKLAELNRYLAYLPMTGNDLSSYDNSSAELEKSSESIDIILNIIYISVLIIVSLCLAFLTYLFYHGRFKEFAILYVIGYSKQTIILRNIIEVFFINAVSAIAGILGSLLIGIVLNITIFNVIGTPLLLLEGKTLVLSLCVPMLCIISQTLTIGFTLNHADMVGIIEFESGGVS